MHAARISNLTFLMQRRRFVHGATLSLTLLQGRRHQVQVKPAI